jgi:hypothetical protein
LEGIPYELEIKKLSDAWDKEINGSKKLGEIKVIKNLFLKKKDIIENFENLREAHEKLFLLYGEYQQEKPKALIEVEINKLTQKLNDLDDKYKKICPGNKVCPQDYNKAVYLNQMMTDLTKKRNDLRNNGTKESFGEAQKLLADIDKNFDKEFSEAENRDALVEKIRKNFKIIKSRCDGTAVKNIESAFEDLDKRNSDKIKTHQSFFENPNDNEIKKRLYCLSPEAQTLLEKESDDEIIKRLVSHVNRETKASYYRKKILSLFGDKPDSNPGFTPAWDKYQNWLEKNGPEKNEPVEKIGDFKKFYYDLIKDSNEKKEEAIKKIEDEYKKLPEEQQKLVEKIKDKVENTIINSNGNGGEAIVKDIEQSEVASTDNRVTAFLKTLKSIVSSFFNILTTASKQEKETSQTMNLKNEPKVNNKNFTNR